MKFEHICIYGTGGVGGYFGGKMALELRGRGDGRKIYFIARGKHLGEIRAHGLILDTDAQKGLVCVPDMATDKIAQIPAPDLCLMCVKGYDLDESVRALSRNMKAGTVVLPLLNGVDIYDRIRSILPETVILPACTYVGTHVERPGKVAQKGGDGIIVFGRDPEHPLSEAYDDAAVLLNETKIACRRYDDVFPAIWEKYIFIAAFGLVTAASGKPLGAVMADPELRAQAEGIMREITALAEKKHITLPRDIVERTMVKAGDFPVDTKTSYQRDVEQPGKRTEGDLFGGTIIRYGEALGVPTPVTRRVYARIEKR